MMRRVVNSILGMLDQTRRSLKHRRRQVESNVEDAFNAFKLTDCNRDRQRRDETLTAMNDATKDLETNEDVDYFTRALRDIISGTNVKPLLWLFGSYAHEWNRIEIARFDEATGELTLADASAQKSWDMVKSLFDVKLTNVVHQMEFKPASLFKDQEPSYEEGRWMCVGFEGPVNLESHVDVPYSLTEATRDFHNMIQEFSMVDAIQEAEPTALKREDDQALAGTFTRTLLIATLKPEALTPV